MYHKRVILYGGFNMIKNGTFTSVWDGGYEVTTKCKINMDTKEVFDIEKIGIDADVLEYEYITLDGNEYSVSRDNEDADFWYE